MFIAVTVAALLAGVFAHLGALSVKVSVLTVALQCSVVIALLATLTAIWSVFMINRR